jgi:hypothetical protein
MLPDHPREMKLEPLRKRPRSTSCAHREDKTDWAGNGTERPGAGGEARHRGRKCAKWHTAPDSDIREF